VLEINVAQLEKSLIGTTREYDIDDTLELEGQSVSLTGQVVMIRTNRSVLVKGELQGAVDMECSRCLRRYTAPVAFTFEEEFFPAVDVTSGLLLETHEEEGDFVIDENHVLDLTEAARQYLILAQPMKPLCRTDCPGILPQAG
jgi:uncharacterized protein